MLCTLYQIQVTMKSIVTCVLLRSGKSSYKNNTKVLISAAGIQRKFQQNQQGVLPTDCLLLLRNHRARHTLCHYCISTMKSRGLGLLGAHTCRLPLRTKKPPELFRQFDCVALLSYKIKTAYRYVPKNNTTTNTPPPTSSPKSTVSPWRSGMQNNHHHPSTSH